MGWKTADFLCMLPIMALPALAFTGPMGYTEKKKGVRTYGV
jgi:hypothetical protein